MKTKHYSAEYMQQAVYRVCLGQESIPAIARDLGVSVTSLRDCIKQLMYQRLLYCPASNSLGVNGTAGNIVHHITWERASKRRSSCWSGNDFCTILQTTR